MSKRGSGELIRLPLESHVFGVQPVKFGDGPRYTKTFFEPDGVVTLTEKRGDPALQSSSVTLNSVASVVIEANVVTPVPASVTPPKSSATSAFPVFETICNDPFTTVAAPNGVAVPAAMAGLR